MRFTLILLLFASFNTVAKDSKCSLNFVTAQYLESENFILLWENVKGDLGDVQITYKTENFISNVVSSVDENNQPIIVWHESGDKGNRLLSTVKDVYNKWLPPVVIESSKNELTSLSLVKSPGGVIYLSWASDLSGNDDVYLSQFSQGKWGDAVAVNPKNKVPDILPTLSVNFHGSVELVWRTLSSQVIGYEDKSIILTSALTTFELEQFLKNQCSYDRASIKSPDSDEPLFINYYQDVFDSYEKNEF